MAGGVFQNNGTKSIALVVIFLFSLWTPFFSVQDLETSFEDAQLRGFSGPFHLESGYGHDIGAPGKLSTPPARRWRPAASRPTIGVFRGALTATPSAFDTAA